MENVLFLEFGDLFFEYSFLYPETRYYFDNSLKECPNTNKIPKVNVTQEFIEETKWLVDEQEPSEGFLEFQSLMIATGNLLLSYDRALFHGAAFLWKEKAWILTAPSGTGKTTQLSHWKRYFKTALKVINGDKPLLECREDGSLWVYSSPWRGKEGYGKTKLRASLGGIIFLEQGNKNIIRQMTPKEAVRPLFSEFICLPENTEQIKHLAQILRIILNTVPVWKLINLGDEDSTKLAIETLENYLEGINE